MNIKEPNLEKRKSQTSFFLLDNHRPGRGIETVSMIVIGAGGIAQTKYRGRRVGVRITGVAGNQFVGRIFAFEYPSEQFEDLVIGDFIKLHEENIFGYDPPMGNN